MSNASAALRALSLAARSADESPPPVTLGAAAAAASAARAGKVCPPCKKPDSAATEADVDVQMQAAFRVLLNAIGEDPDRPGLRLTPARAAKALRFLTSGYSSDAATVVGDAMFPVDRDPEMGEPSSLGMVVVRDIPIHSLCEHHLLPFHGKAHIGYLPNGSVLGLSKVARIADVYARRLQMQERLTVQIASALMDVTRARGVAVVIEAAHMCMCMRGVQKPNATTTTESMQGAFLTDRELRREFVTYCQGPRSAL